jgi:hypothetical protein
MLVGGSPAIECCAICLNSAFVRRPRCKL